MNITLTTGDSYEVVKEINPARAIVLYSGLYVLVDKDPSAGTWDLSGVPASPDEEELIKQLTASMTDTTIVVVTPPE